MTVEQELQELLNSPLFWISILFLIIFSIAIITMTLYTFLSTKIHNSYHKGYNKAKSDKVQYYKTIKELIDSFDKMIIELKKDNLKLSIPTTQRLIDFKQSLKDYYNN